MVSLLGVTILLAVAVGLSSNRSAIRPRTILLAFALQAGMGFFCVVYRLGHHRTVAGIRIRSGAAGIQ